MKKLLTLVVSLVLLLTIACKDKKDAEESAPVEEAAPAIEEVAPAESVE
jgi:hypothetical protein